MCALTLLFAPLALGHEPAGSSRGYCEPSAEWTSHDYDVAVQRVAGTPPPEPGTLLRGEEGVRGRPGKVVPPYVDGNTEPCVPDVLWPTCTFLPEATDIRPETRSLACHGAYDGHHEFGIGGAALLVSLTGDWVTSGGVACYGEEGHHSQYGTLELVDATYAEAVVFVGADVSDPAWPTPPGEPDCGDGIIQPCHSYTPPPPSTMAFPLNVVEDTVNLAVENVHDGIGRKCTVGDEMVGCILTPSLPSWPCVSFRPGIDGAYHVVVMESYDTYMGTLRASRGHISL